MYDKRYDNVKVLNETLALLNNGEYISVSGRKVPMKLSVGEMCAAKVYLPRDIEALSAAVTPAGDSCEINCVKMDSYQAARVRSYRGTDGRVLVLNFANPVHKGGGVYHGASAQEESLCRCSTLLRSIESEAADAYYIYNRGLNTYMGSDAIIISPNVEIIRDENYNLMEETEIAAVMTCAAPMINSYAGMGDLGYEDYLQLIKNRIFGMLKVAAANGYRHLILGAFGCGAFGNDARIVSDLFREALEEFTMGGYTTAQLFNSIDFAVRSRGHESYNYLEFARNFKR